MEKHVSTRFIRILESVRLTILEIVRPIYVIYSRKMILFVIFEIERFLLSFAILNQVYFHSILLETRRKYYFS